MMWILSSLNIPAQRRWELFKLVIYFLTVVAVSVHLAPVIGAGWESRGLPWHLFYGGVNAVGIEYHDAVAFPVGVYLGLLGLLAVDRYKRVQAALLGMATVAAGFIFIYQLGLAPIDWISGLLALVGGIIVGGLAGGGRKLYEGTPPFQFPRATQLLFVVLSLVVIVSIFEFHVDYSPPFRAAGGTLVVSSTLVTPVSASGAGLITNLIAMGLFVGTLYRFTEYENERKFMILGPARSGKTTLMTGLFATVSGGRGGFSGDDEISWNDEMRQYHTDLTAPEEGFGDIGVSTEGTDAVPLEFTYPHGDLFPRKVTVRTIDYAGERLDENLVDTIEECFEEEGNALSGIVDSIAGELSDEEEFIERGFDTTFPDERLTNQSGRQIRRLLAGQLLEADTVMLVFPLDEFAADYDVSIDELDYFEGSIPRTRDQNYPGLYAQILETFKREGEEKKAVLVPTMADLAVPIFEDEIEGEGTFIEHASIADFGSFIEREHLSDDRFDLLDHHRADDNVYPVYFEANDEEPESGGEMNPQRDEGVVVKGAKELLDALGRL